MSRSDGRRPDRLRPITIEPDYLEQPHGCALITQGKTIVLCTAMVSDEVPRWLRNQGRGWMTAEYSLLPASTGDRVEREASRGKPAGTHRRDPAADRPRRPCRRRLPALGERTMWLDCDVLQADGGTRCAAISGAYVAARRALDRFGLSKAFTDSVAAVSVGVVGGVPVLDLDYEEDSAADVDMNVVMTGDGRLIEVQATAEKDPFSARAPRRAARAGRVGNRRDRGTSGGSRCRCTPVGPFSAPGTPQGARARAALPGWTIDPLDADEWPPEEGETYVENARGKARFGRAAAGSGGWTIGEDSGLEVEALGGRPGIESARYAPEGAPAIAKLLGALAGVPADRRRARYVSELVALVSRRRGAARHGHACRPHRRRAAWERGLRLRPGLRPGRRGADRRGARERLEGAELASRPRGARAPGGARCGGGVTSSSSGRPC